jgi:hypothetical protein
MLTFTNDVSLEYVQDQVSGDPPEGAGGRGHREANRPGTAQCVDSTPMLSLTLICNTILN